RRELILSHCTLRRTRALCRNCFCSCLSDRIQSTALVGGVALYRFDQVGDEISSAFELDVDVGPGVLRTHAQRDEAVVNEDEENYDKDDDQEADEHGFWGVGVHRRCASRAPWSTRDAGDLHGCTSCPSRLKTRYWRVAGEIDIPEIRELSYAQYGSKGGISCEES